MPRTLLRILIAIAICASASAATSSPKLRFESDVRPILKTHCFHCHGEGEKLRGDVDLRLRHFMAEKATDDGKVLIPGKAGSSLVYTLAKSGEMPKGEKKLSAKELATLEQWIAAGAPTLYDEPKELPKGFFISEQEKRFWSFQPINRPVRSQFEKCRARAHVD